MNAAERHKVKVAMYNLRILLEKDKNALMPAEEMLDWLEEL